MIRLALLALFSTALALTPSARADDVWTQPHNGIRHLHRTDFGIDLHVVLVDLANPSLSIVATRPVDRFITTSEFARRYDAAVAINTNFYARQSCGLAVGNGELFDDSYEDGCTASLGFGSNNQAIAFDSSLTPRGPLPAPWVREVLTGKPWLMRDGRAELNWQRPQRLYRSNPRSAAGLTADRRTLVLMAADGRRFGIEGLNGFQLVETLRSFGVSDAVNLDGGGSTSLVIDGQVVNQPSDHRERAVVTHLGVRLVARTALRAGLGPCANTSPRPLAWVALAVFASLTATLRARRNDLRCEPDSRRSPHS